MGPGGSASLGFPLCATVPVSKQAPPALGEGGLEHIPHAGGWDWALCTWEPGAVSLEEGLPRRWALGEERNLRVSSLMHFLKGGVCPREQRSWIILWESGISFSCFNCWGGAGWKSLHPPVYLLSGARSHLSCFDPPLVSDNPWFGEITEAND